MLASPPLIRDSRRQILDAAAIMFSQQGYQAASMRDLARQVGLQPSSLYSHFGSKEDILWSIALECAEAFMEAVKPIAESNLALKPRLREMMVKHVVVVLQQQKRARVYMEEWKNLSETRRIEYAAQRDEYEQLFRNVFQQGVENYVFAELDEKFASLAILSALNWTYTWYRPQGELTPEEIGQKLADLLLNGFNRNV